MAYHFKITIQADSAFNEPPEVCATLADAVEWLDQIFPCDPTDYTITDDTGEDKRTDVCNQWLFENFDRYNSEGYEIPNFVYGHSYNRVRSLERDASEEAYYTRRPRYTRAGS
jgi:hypothetical protein